MVVSLGQEITAEPQAGWEKLTIEWSQMFQQRRGVYWKVDFTNDSPGATEKTGLLFIADEKVGEFKSHARQDGEAFKVKVDNSFQYGQKKGGTNRWLVYHDTSRNPYQHRFVKAAISKVGEKAVETANKLGYSQVESVGNALEAHFGDPLHKF